MDATSLEEDRRLLHLIAEGNQQLFDDLFNTYYAYLLNIAYRYTKDFDLSKDLVQEVFLDIWRRRASIEINTSLRSFLKRAVINQSISVLKKRNNNTDILDGNIQKINASNAQDNIEYIELNKKIELTIDQMPCKCKEIFLLSREEDLSHKEIAKKLNISTKTIENQITKALKILRKALSKDYLLSLIISISMAIL